VDLRNNLLGRKGVDVALVFKKDVLLVPVYKLKKKVCIVTKRCGE